MDDGQPFNNFAQVLYTFYVHYCAAEGLDETSDLARKVLLYLFYTELPPRPRKASSKSRKPKKAIHCLRKKIMSSRCRYGKYVTRYFKGFLVKLKENQDWTKYFADKGEGKAPLDYLIEIENGLRRFARDVHAMGTGTL